MILATQKTTRRPNIKNCLKFGGSEAGHITTARIIRADLYMLGFSPAEVMDEMNAFWSFQEGNGPFDAFSSWFSRAYSIPETLNTSGEKEECNKFHETIFSVSPLLFSPEHLKVSRFASLLCSLMNSSIQGRSKGAILDAWLKLHSQAETLQDSLVED